MKVKISLRNTKDVPELAICKLLLNEEMSIFTLPQQIRIKSRRYYVYSFRLLRGIKNQELHAQILELLKNDITCITEKNKAYLFKQFYELEVENYNTIYKPL